MSWPGRPGLQVRAGGRRTPAGRWPGGHQLAGAPVPEGNHRQEPGDQIAALVSSGTGGMVSQASSVSSATMLVTSPVSYARVSRSMSRFSAAEPGAGGSPGAYPLDQPVARASAGQAKKAGASPCPPTCSPSARRSVPLTQMLAGIGLEPAGAPPPGWPGCRSPPCAVHGAPPGRSPSQAAVCRRPEVLGIDDRRGRAGFPLPRDLAARQLTPTWAAAWPQLIRTHRKTPSSPMIPHVTGLPPAA